MWLGRRSGLILYAVGFAASLATAMSGMYVMLKALAEAGVPNETIQQVLGGTVLVLLGVGLGTSWLHGLVELILARGRRGG